MTSRSRIVRWIYSAAAALLTLCGSTLAQYTLGGPDPGGVSLRSQWEQRVVRTGLAPPRTPSQATLTDYRLAQRPSTGPGAVSGLAMGEQTMVPGREGAVMVGGAESILPFEEDEVAGGYASPDPGCAGCGEFGCAGDCGSCGPWGDDCGGCGYQCRPGRGILSGWWCQDFSLFAGVHGFKGPTDRGLNGNFGFQEGVNHGAPLGVRNIGYQLGFAANQSNFSGDQTLTDFTAGDAPTARRGNRHQYFITAGLFRRALCGGFQGGVVFDLMQDVYYDRADLKQIRSETSFVFPGGRNELGYFGAYNVGEDRLLLRDRLRNEVLLAPTDMFVAFYRRHFESGGEGRVWAGLSGRGNAMVGADLRVPLGGSWAVENSFNYLIPKEGPGASGVREEAWGLNIQLVWYPGRRAACVRESSYRPLFGVADNSTFLVHTRGETTTPQD